MTKTPKNYSDPDIAYHCPVHVRWSDMDSYGHVNNARTVTLIEEIRIHFMGSDPTLLTMLAQGIVIADLNIQYKGQILYHHTPLQGSLWISQVRASDFIMEYRLRAKDVPADSRPQVVASTRVVAFDFTNQCVRRFTPGETETLHKYLFTES